MAARCHGSITAFSRAVQRQIRTKLISPRSLLVTRMGLGRTRCRLLRTGEGLRAKHVTLGSLVNIRLRTPARVRSAVSTIETSGSL